MVFPTMTLVGSMQQSTSISRNEVFAEKELKISGLVTEMILELQRPTVYRYHQRKEAGEQRRL